MAARQGSDLLTDARRLSQSVAFTLAHLMHFPRRSETEDVEAGVMGELGHQRHLIVEAGNHVCPSFEALLLT